MEEVFHLESGCNLGCSSQEGGGQRLEHFEDSDHNSINFKTVLNREKFGPCGKVLNCSKAKYNFIRQEPRRIHEERYYQVSLHLTRGSH